MNFQSEKKYSRITLRMGKSCPFSFLSCIASGMHVFLPLWGMLLANKAIKIELNVKYNLAYFDNFQLLIYHINGTVVMSVSNFGYGFPFVCVRVVYAHEKN